MQTAEFWIDKNIAQNKILELKKLKEKLGGEKALYAGPAILNIISGSGGDDSEDFAYLLLRMYEKYFDKNNYVYKILHLHENEHKGIKNITLEINSKNAYGNLHGESGVHRLVRISPFNANAKRLREKN